MTNKPNYDADSDSTIEPEDITDQTPEEPEEPTELEEPTEPVEPEPEPIEPVKQKRGRGRPKGSKTKNRKPEPEVVVKEAVLVKPKAKPKKPADKKVVYVVQDPDTGEVTETARPPAKLTIKQSKAIEKEEEALAAELEVGKRLVRTKKGGIDNRSFKPRTQAQIDATARLVAANKARYEARKAQKELELQQLQNAMKQDVRDVLVEAISNPKSLRSTTPTNPTRPSSAKQLGKQLLG